MGRLLFVFLHFSFLKAPPYSLEPAARAPHVRASYLILKGAYDAVSQRPPQAYRDNPCPRGSFGHGHVHRCVELLLRCLGGELVSSREFHEHDKRFSFFLYTRLLDDLLSCTTLLSCTVPKGALVAEGAMCPTNTFGCLR